MASRKRVDIQERKHLVRLEEFEGGDISFCLLALRDTFGCSQLRGTFDDLAEYTGSV